MSNSMVLPTKKPCVTIESMQYTFSWVWFFVGLVAFVGGAVILKYYDKVSEFMGSGVAGYQRWKIVALCVSGAGLIMMFNLHTFILGFIAQLIFGGAIGH